MNKRIHSAQERMAYVRSLQALAEECGLPFCVVHALKGKKELCQLYADRLNRLTFVKAEDRANLSSDNTKVVRATLTKLLGHEAMESFGGNTLGRSELYALAKGIKDTFKKGIYTR